MKADVDVRMFLNKQDHIIYGSIGDRIERRPVLGILVWFVFFVFELVCMAVCYKFIYQKKSITNKSLFDFIRLLAGYYIFIIRYKRHRISQDQEMDNLLEQNGELRHALFLQGGLEIVRVTVIPSLTVLMIQCFCYSWISVIIFLAGVYVWIDRLKESRIKNMILLNEGQKFLYKLERIKKRMMNNQEVSKIQTKENGIKTGKKASIQIGITWFIIVCGDLLPIILFKDMLGWLFELRMIKETVFVLPVCIALLLLGYLSYGIFRLLDKEAMNGIRQRFGYSRYIKNKSEIQVWASEEIGDLMDEFLYMCDLLNIKEVKIVLGDLNNVKVCSYVDNGQMPVVFIRYDVFIKAKETYQQEYREIIKMLTAHELVHIYYKDTTWMRKVSVLILLIYGVVIALVVVGKRRGNVVCLMIAAAYFVFDCTIPRILRDKRYWSLVKEFRADAIGMEISQTSAEVFEKAMKCIAAAEEEDGFIRDKKKDSLLYRLYNCNVEQQIHPSMERRIYEARRGRKWGKREYIRYLWMICRNVFTGKGWKI